MCIRGGLRSGYIPVCTHVNPVLHCWRFARPFTIYDRKSYQPLGLQTQLNDVYERGLRCGYIRVYPCEPCATPLRIRSTVHSVWVFNRPLSFPCRAPCRQGAPCTGHCQTRACAATGRAPTPAPTAPCWTRPCPTTSCSAARRHTTARCRPAWCTARARPT